MSALRHPRQFGILLLGLCGTAALAGAAQGSFRMPWSAAEPGFVDRLSQMRDALPIDMADGSALRDVVLGERRLVLRFDVDDRLDLAAIRDGDRDGKCAAWRQAFRDRELVSVEYRYVQTGAISSLFLDRTSCS